VHSSDVTRQVTQLSHPADTLAAEHGGLTEGSPPKTPGGTTRCTFGLRRQHSANEVVTLSITACDTPRACRWAHSAITVTSICLPASTPTVPLAMCHSVCFRRGHSVKFTPPRILLTHPAPRTTLAPLHVQLTLVTRCIRLCQLTLRIHHVADFHVAVTRHQWNQFHPRCAQSLQNVSRSALT